MSELAYARLSGGSYAVAIGSEKIGTMRGDYAAGFWVYLNDGTQLAGTFTTPEDAAQVLALEFAMRCGPTVYADAGTSS